MVTTSAREGMKYQILIEDLVFDRWAESRGWENHEDGTFSKGNHYQRVGPYVVLHREFQNDIEDKVSRRFI